jgi:hypothetical protein
VTTSPRSSGRRRSGVRSPITTYPLSEKPGAVHLCFGAVEISFRIFRHAPSVHGLLWSGPRAALKSSTSTYRPRPSR